MAGRIHGAARVLDCLSTSCALTRRFWDYPCARTMVLHVLCLDRPDTKCGRCVIQNNAAELVLSD